MAGGGSGGRGAYWIGALVGLVFSGSLAAVLSLVTPLPDAGAATGGNVAAEPAASAETDAQRQTTVEKTVTEETAAAPDDSAATPGAAPAESAPAPPQADQAAATPAPSQTEAPAPAAPADENQQIALATPQPAAPAPAQPAPAEPAPAQPAPAQPEPEATAPASPEPVEEEPARVIATPGGLAPFKANAEIYSGDRSQPLLAIVLTDVTSENQTRLDEIMLLPGPLAVVVPAGSAGAEATILDARDAGFEAMVGVGSAEVSGASASGEVAAALSDRLAASPMVLGAALAGEALQASAAAEGAVSALADNGFALLDMTADGGGAPYRLAKSRNAPAAPNGRRFDEADSSALVFQSLERAAFDARRTGAFVVVGAATPAVLTGLRRWMNVKANRSVAVAPLSAVIEKISKQ